MNNKELSILLTEAADLLFNDTEDNDSVLTEAIKSSDGKTYSFVDATDFIEQLKKEAAETSNDEGKKLVNDVKDAIKDEDEKKLRKALSNFKKWYYTADPEGKHQKIRTGLIILQTLFEVVVSYGSKLLGTLSTVGLVFATKKSSKIVWITTLVASLGSCLLLTKAKMKDAEITNEVQSETIDEFINKYEKKVNDLKKSLDNYKGDKTGDMYKSIAKSYKDASQWLDWFKSRKDQITKTKNVKDTKQDLKDAKKSKDKQKIAEAKAKYKIAKSLVESALDILGYEDLNESVGVADKSTGKVVKVFKTNKEASDWIYNNGGNDAYQLTNRLK